MKQPKQPRKSSTSKPSMSMFTGASRMTIERGEFNSVGGDQIKNNYVFSTSVYRSQALWDAIAGVGASHDSQERFPPPRCHPKTREKVLNAILKWLNSESRDVPICWLSGPAGVGKSAIAQTIAERCEGGALVASFFFFRQDPKRNNPDYLMMTIAHGLVVNVPELRQPIIRKIAVNPKILESTMKNQFTELVIRPLLAQRVWWNRLRRLWADWPHPSKRRPNLVIIDGLDECTGEDVQTHILNILASELGTNPLPLRFLVCSRPEPWIRDAFYSRSLFGFRKHVVLDNSFSPDEDIERYLRDGFRNVSSCPKYSQVNFPVPWPCDVDIRALVQKAGGQFIYAATVLKFLTDGYLHPLEKLHIVLDVSPNPLHKSIFQELDNLYWVILSTNSDREGLLAILASIFILPIAKISPTPRFIELLLGLPNGQVVLTLRPLHAVLHIDGPCDAIIAFHASFSDYLFHEARSGEFFLDQMEWHDIMVHRWFDFLIEQCTLQLHGPGGSHESNFDSAEVMVFWENWPSFCAALGSPSEVVISRLQDLNLDALLTTAISLSLLCVKKEHEISRRVHPLLPTLWCQFEAIISWLRVSLTCIDGLPDDLIERFATAQKGFYVTISPDIVETFAMWTALNVSNWKAICHFTRRVDDAIFDYVEGTSSMPVTCFSSSPTWVQVSSDGTSKVPECPQAPDEQFYVDLQVAFILVLEHF
ncbi:hypothetical protein L218DRAFT_716008 [Marasmius fiardii PR-910]|nr:hypothetical protein L218DRAFT_716008 [Marasmius fiardii PR-910]